MDCGEDPVARDAERSEGAVGRVEQVDEFVGERREVLAGQLVAGRQALAQAAELG